MVDLDLFYDKEKFATKAFIWENVTIIDSLEILASCDLEFGQYCKLNE